LYESVSFHLLPGAAVLAAYALLAHPLHGLGLPYMMTLWLVCLAVLVPIELGTLYLQGKKRNGAFSLDGIVLNRGKTPAWKFSLWTIAALAWAVACFALLGSLDGILQKMFAWLPEWFFFNGEDLSSYGKGLRFVNWLGILIVTGIVAPYIEELYFRGFLLPRISWMKTWAPVAEAFLFSLYHFWSPWQIVTRFIAVLPLVCIVDREKNMKIGVATHWLLNSVGSLGLLAGIFGNG
jgi:membrane protease YdiL (CAAX protease family)